MIDNALRELSIGVIALSLAAGASILIGASLYDIKLARQTHHKIKKSRRPLISVVVLSHNQAGETLWCLEGLVKSKHRKLEIIVINNASSDDTKQVLSEFKKKHAKRAIKIINKRVLADSQAAIKSALRVFKGDSLLLLTPNSSVEPATLGQVADKLTQKSDKAVVPAVVIAPSPSTFALWLSFKNLIRVNWQKTASLLRPSGSGLHFGVFYSRSMAKAKDMQQDYEYDSRVVLLRRPNASLTHPALNIHEQAVPVKSTKRSALRPLLSFIGFIYYVIALPVFTWYGLYLALNRGYSFLLFLSWCIFTFVYLLSVWGNEHLVKLAKARLSALAPAVFSLAIIMIFVEAVAKIFSLVRLDKLQRF